jgi:hypothetical protein
MTAHDGASSTRIPGSCFVFGIGSHERAGWADL